MLASSQPASYSLSASSSVTSASERINENSYFITNFTARLRPQSSRPPAEPFPSVDGFRPSRERPVRRLPSHHRPPGSERHRDSKQPICRQARAERLERCALCSQFLLDAFVGPPATLYHYGRTNPSILHHGSDP